MNEKLTYDDVLRRGKRVVEDNKKHKALIAKLHLSNFMKNGFWFIVVICIVAGLGYYAFTKKDVALKFVQEKAAAILKVKELIPTANPAIVPAVQTVSCENITITSAPTDKNPNAKKISAVYIGKCYNIADADREFWKLAFSDGNEASKYAAYIYSESTDHSLTPDEVVLALGKSFTTNVLDLRKAAPPPPPTNTPEPTAVPTQVVTATPESTPTPEPTATPAATSTPSVMVVPFPEKERSLDLAGLAATMLSHNIPAVASNNSSKDFHDKVNWQMWYPVGSGKDYVIFNTITSSLPPNCNANTTFISVSLNNTGQEGEVATKAGESQVWIVCK